MKKKKCNMDVFSEIYSSALNTERSSVHGSDILKEQSGLADIWLSFFFPENKWAAPFRDETEKTNVIYPTQKAEWRPVRGPFRKDERFPEYSSRFWD